MTHTPWVTPMPGGRLHAMPSSGPADQPAREPASCVRQSLDSDRLVHAVDLTSRSALLGHELAVAAEKGGDEDGELARRFAASLSPKARLVLLSALAETDTSHTDSRPALHRSGRPSAPSGEPELTVTPAPSGLSILPAYQEPGPDRTASQNHPPACLIRLRFADAIALKRADAAFGAASGPDFGDTWSDPVTLTVRITCSVGVETLRAVLAVLDAAAIAPESLTVHTHELDDVFAAFTSLP